MIDYRLMHACLEDAGMTDWSTSLRSDLDAYFSHVRHGDYADWQAAIASLPDLQTTNTKFDQPVVTIGDPAEVSEAQRHSIETQLKRLMPWRKGPFKMFGVDIDAEWRSDWKWQRVQPHCRDLTGRSVLDIGCGNGYYGWRMLGAGARFVIGVDPTLRFVMQFQAMKRYLPALPHFVLPFGIQQIETATLHFDSVFSMGVIYHRKDPHEHLQTLFNCLNDEGELVLESLIIDEAGVDVLQPDGRYAKMNNVWHIPSCNTLAQWLEKAGFTDVRTVDCTSTTTDEQRVTDWMQFESLNDFLSPSDNSKTIEGYPAPKRAILLATKR